MALWEYKVITSGKGGFATPALLEKFLNDLGRDEWEIMTFQTQHDNFLAFTGLARRPTQRDWTLEDAAAAAARAEADKLRAEFEAKFKAANQPAATEERAPSFLEEKVAPDDGFRKPVDTSRDDEPEDEEEAKADQWDKLDEEDDLPTFFDAIKPHMRRNQRGPGMSVGIDYLAKKWDQSEEDLMGALTECGFVIPADEDAKPEYLEYDGDLYWVNVNRRGELWINTKDKPRPVFRPVKAQKAIVEDEPPRGQRKQEESKPDTGDRKPETSEGAAEGATGEPETQNARPQTAATAAAPLPAGPELLQKIRPHMRRNRRGPGGSGSTNFLSRALRTNETELKTAFAALGLAIPTNANDKPVYTEIGNEVWWLNLDSRGGLWINGREKKAGETIGAAQGEAKEGETPSESPSPSVVSEAVAAPEVSPSAPSSTDPISPAPTPGEEPVPSPLGSELPGSAAPASSAVAEENGSPVAPPALQSDSGNETAEGGKSEGEKSDGDKADGDKKPRRGGRSRKKPEPSE